ncbi:MAG: hypothetical protein KDD38_02755, partial [Bdellovibrionales bacterium]|nr:hypothetical protein [Bdellovibrionales bacterium]
ALVPELLAAAERLEAEAEKVVRARGEKYLTDLIRTNHFIVEDSELNIKMEYRLIDGHRVPRLLVHDEVYILVDEQIIPRNSKHLQQYISRTHHESGPNRVAIDKNGNPLKTIFGNDKKTTGRNLTVLYLNEDVTNVEHLPKPKVTQWKWWKEYFISKYKKPTLDDVSMAFFTGFALQGALILAGSTVKNHFLGAAFTLAPTYWTMAYGQLVGTYYSTVKNWTINSGSKPSRIAKSQVVSTLYAVGLVMAVTDGSMADKLSTISLLTSEGRAKDVSILANGVMNNFAKDYWNQIPRIREQTRENANDLTFKIPFTQKTFAWKQASLEAQLLYLIPWSINVISLMTLATTDCFQIPGTNITLPVLQFAGIPIAMYWAKWYSRHLAKKHKDDPHAQVRAREYEQMAKTQENAWKASFGMDVKDIPEKVSGWVDAIKNSTKEVTKKCLNLLKGPV